MFSGYRLPLLVKLVRRLRLFLWPIGSDGLLLSVTPWCRARRSSPASPPLAGLYWLRLLEVVWLVFGSGRLRGFILLSSLPEIFFFFLIS